MRYLLLLLTVACQLPEQPAPSATAERTATPEEQPDDPPADTTDDAATPDEDPAPTAIYLPKRISVDGETNQRTNCSTISYVRSGFLRVDCGLWVTPTPIEEAFYMDWMRAYVEDQGFTYLEDFEIIISSVAGQRSATLYILIDLPYGGIRDEVYQYD